MYANPLLVVHAVYSTFKGYSVYYNVHGGISENNFFRLNRNCFTIKKRKEKGL